MAFFECSKCSKSYKKQSSLKSHQRMHNGTAFICDVCEKRFVHKSKLEQHSIAHTIEKPFACNVEGCEKKFNHKSGMHKHRRAVHERVSGKHRCEQCPDRLFNTPDKLNCHRRTHTGERPFACDICDRRFTFKQALQNHVIVHTFETPYTCDVGGCEKKFARKSDMQSHKRAVHERVPGKHQCEQCPDRTFNNLTHLNSHRRTHTGERPFKCTDCAKTYTVKSRVQAHYRAKHALDRPYACEDVCDIETS